MRSDEVTVPFRPPADSPVGLGTWRRAVARAGDAYAQGRLDELYRDCIAEVTKLSGTTNAELTSSGTAALVLALMGLGIGRGDEVITVSNTFVATVEAIRLVGGTPVLVDVEEATQNIDADAVLAALTCRTRAVIIVHLYGRPAVLGTLVPDLRSRGIHVVEDACQALAAFDGERWCGSIGDVACFSFGRTKPLAGAGEGGAVVTDRPEIAHRLHALNRHGRLDGEHVLSGINLRMHPVEAAVVGERLRRWDAWIVPRRRIAACYNAGLEDLGLLGNSLVGDGMLHANYVYVVRSDARDRLAGFLVDRGIQTRIHYPVPIHRQSAHADLMGTCLPVTDRLAARILSLPMYVELTEQAVNKVLETIHTFVGGRWV
jgi:dTDP-4-amino-4,6-dideoxygalactose transaminase